MMEASRNRIAQVDQNIPGSLLVLEDQEHTPVARRTVSRRRSKAKSETKLNYSSSAQADKLPPIIQEVVVQPGGFFPTVVPKPMQRCFPNEVGNRAQTAIPRQRNVRPPSAKSNPRPQTAPEKTNRRVLADQLGKIQPQTEWMKDLDSLVGNSTAWEKRPMSSRSLRNSLLPMSDSEFVVEYKRRAKTPSAAVTIQNWWRACRERKKFLSYLDLRRKTMTRILLPYFGSWMILTKAQKMGRLGLLGICFRAWSQKARRKEQLFLPRRLRGISAPTVARITITFHTELEISSTPSSPPISSIHASFTKADQIIVARMKKDLQSSVRILLLERCVKLCFHRWVKWSRKRKEGRKKLDEAMKKAAQHIRRMKARDMLRVWVVWTKLKKSERRRNHYYFHDSKAADGSVDPDLAVQELKEFEGEILGYIKNEIAISDQWLIDFVTAWQRRSALRYIVNSGYILNKKRRYFDLWQQWRVVRKEQEEKNAKANWLLLSKYRGYFLEWMSFVRERRKERAKVKAAFKAWRKWCRWKKRIRRAVSGGAIARRFYQTRHALDLWKAYVRRKKILHCAAQVSLRTSMSRGYLAAYTIMKDTTQFHFIYCWRIWSGYAKRRILFKQFILAKEQMRNLKLMKICFDALKPKRKGSLIGNVFQNCRLSVRELLMELNKIKLGKSKPEEKPLKKVQEYVESLQLDRLSNVTRATHRFANKKRSSNPSVFRKKPVLSKSATLILDKVPDDTTSNSEGDIVQTFEDFGDPPPFRPRMNTLSKMKPTKLKLHFLNEAYKNWMSDCDVFIWDVLKVYGLERRLEMRTHKMMNIEYSRGGMKEEEDDGEEAEEARFQRACDIMNAIGCIAPSKLDKYYRGLREDYDSACELVRYRKRRDAFLLATDATAEAAVKLHGVRKSFTIEKIRVKKKRKPFPPFAPTSQGFRGKSRPIAFKFTIDEIFDEWEQDSKYMVDWHTGKRYLDDSPTEIRKVEKATKNVGLIPTLVQLEETFEKLPSFSLNTQLFEMMKEMLEENKENEQEKRKQMNERRLEEEMERLRMQEELRQGEDIKNVTEKKKFVSPSIQIDEAIDSSTDLDEEDKEDDLTRSEGELEPSIGSETDREDGENTERSTGGEGTQDSVEMSESDREPQNSPHRSEEISELSDEAVDDYTAGLSPQMKKLRPGTLKHLRERQKTSQQERKQPQLSLEEKLSATAKAIEVLSNHEKAKGSGYYVVSEQEERRYQQIREDNLREIKERVERERRDSLGESETSNEIYEDGKHCGDLETQNSSEQNREEARKDIGHKDEAVERDNTKETVEESEEEKLKEEEEKAAKEKEEEAERAAKEQEEAAERAAKEQEEAAEKAAIEKEMEETFMREAMERAEEEQERKRKSLKQLQLVKRKKKKKKKKLLSSKETQMIRERRRRELQEMRELEAKTLNQTKMEPIQTTFEEPRETLLQPLQQRPLVSRFMMSPMPPPLPPSIIRKREGSKNHPEFFGLSSSITPSPSSDSLARLSVAESLSEFDQSEYSFDDDSGGELDNQVLPILTPMHDPVLKTKRAIKVSNFLEEADSGDDASLKKNIKQKEEKIGREKPPIVIEPCEKPYVAVVPYPPEIPDKSSAYQLLGSPQGEREHVGGIMSMPKKVRKKRGKTPPPSPRSQALVQSILGTSYRAMKALSNLGILVADDKSQSESESEDSEVEEQDGDGQDGEKHETREEELEEDAEDVVLPPQEEDEDARMESQDEEMEGGEREDESDREEEIRTKMIGYSYQLPPRIDIVFDPFTVSTRLNEGVEDNLWPPEVDL